MGSLFSIGVTTSLSDLMGNSLLVQSKHSNIDSTLDKIQKTLMETIQTHLKEYYTFNSIEEPDYVTGMKRMTSESGKDKLSIASSELLNGELNTELIRDRLPLYKAIKGSDYSDLDSLMFITSTMAISYKVEHCMRVADNKDDESKFTNVFNNETSKANHRYKQSLIDELISLNPDLNTDTLSTVDIRSLLVELPTWETIRMYYNDEEAKLDHIVELVRYQFEEGYKNSSSTYSNEVEEENRIDTKLLDGSLFTDTFSRTKLGHKFVQLTSIIFDKNLDHRVYGIGMHERMEGLTTEDGTVCDGITRLIYAPYTIIARSGDYTVRPHLNICEKCGAVIGLSVVDLKYILDKAEYSYRDTSSKANKFKALVKENLTKLNPGLDYYAKNMPELFYPSIDAFIESSTGATIDSQQAGSIFSAISSYMIEEESTAKVDLTLWDSMVNDYRNLWKRSSYSQLEGVSGIPNKEQLALAKEFNYDLSYNNKAISNSIDTTEYCEEEVFARDLSNPLVDRSIKKYVQIVTELARLNYEEEYHKSFIAVLSSVPKFVKIKDKGFFKKDISIIEDEIKSKGHGVSDITKPDLKVYSEEELLKEFFSMSLPLILSKYDSGIDTIDIPAYIYESDNLQRMLDNIIHKNIVSRNIKQFETITRGYSEGKKIYKYNRKSDYLNVAMEELNNLGIISSNLSQHYTDDYTRFKNSFADTLTRANSSSLPVGKLLLDELEPFSYKGKIKPLMLEYCLAKQSDDETIKAMNMLDDTGFYILKKTLDTKEYLNNVLSINNLDLDRVNASQRTIRFKMPSSVHKVTRNEFDVLSGPNYYSYPLTELFEFLLPEIKDRESLPIYKPEMNIKDWLNYTGEVVPVEEALSNWYNRNYVEYKVVLEASGLSLKYRNSTIETPEEYLNGLLSMIDSIKPILEKTNIITVDMFTDDITDKKKLADCLYKILVYSGEDTKYMTQARELDTFDSYANTLSFTPTKDKPKGTSLMISKEEFFNNSDIKFELTSLISSYIRGINTSNLDVTFNYLINTDGHTTPSDEELLNVIPLKDFDGILDITREQGILVLPKLYDTPEKFKERLKNSYVLPYDKEFDFSLYGKDLCIPYREFGDRLANIKSRVTIDDCLIRLFDNLYQASLAVTKDSLNLTSYILYNEPLVIKQFLNSSAIQGISKLEYTEPIKGILETTKNIFVMKEFIDSIDTPFLAEPIDTTLMDDDFFMEVEKEFSSIFINIKKPTLIAQQYNLMKDDYITENIKEVKPIILSQEKVKLRRHPVIIKLQESFASMYPDSKDEDKDFVREAISKIKKIREPKDDEEVLDLISENLGEKYPKIIDKLKLYLS